MTTATIKLPRPHPAQRDIIDSPARFRVVATGRRFGKTEIGKHEALRVSLEGGAVWYCAPTYRLAKQVWREFKRIVAPLPHTRLNNSDMLAELPTGGRVQFVTLNEPDNLRGSGLDFIVIDEAAFVAEGVWEKVLYPMLLTTKGRALFLSSPNGVNWFYRLWLRGKDEGFPQWQSWRFPSSASPYVDDSELADIKLSTPERVFAAEYESRFLDDGGAVFRNLAACTRDSNDAPAHGSDIVFGIDLGRHNDYTVIVAVDRDSGAVLALDRFTETAWAIQRTRIQAMVERWNPRTVIVEENFNDSFVEAMQSDGLPVRAFRTTASSKAQIINDLAMAFEQESISIPPHPALTGELQAYTLERTNAGSVRYSAPPGMHDDTVMALALAWYGVRTNYEPSQAGYRTIPDIYGR
jgi:hypothetical protein